MKNVNNHLAGKNLRNLKKTEFKKETNDNSKNNQEQKRLLHFALMKFIKTQYNKKQDLLIKKSKGKDFFNKYNNLNLLPYLKRKIYEKNMYISAYPNLTGFNEKKNHFYQTSNINEYNSKNNNLQSQSKSMRERITINKKRHKNRIKSSYEGEDSKYKNFLEISSERKKIFNNNIKFNKDIMKNENSIINMMRKSNFNIYSLNLPFFKRNNSSKSNNIEFANEDDINNEKTNFDTPQRESSLNYKNKLNSVISEIKKKKLFDYINDISNNAEIHNLSIKFGNENKKFEQLFIRKNKNNNLYKNLTYRDDKIISQLIDASPKKNNSKSSIRQNLDKSIDKKGMTIKSFFDSRKIASTEIKNQTFNTMKNMNIKKNKYNLKHTKYDFKNYYKNHYDKYDVKNIEDESKMSYSEKKKPLINNKKKELTDKLHIMTKFGQFNQNCLKIVHKYPIGFNMDINNRKNNNDDIINLI